MDQDLTVRVQADLLPYLINRNGYESRGQGKSRARHIVKESYNYSRVASCGVGCCFGSMDLASMMSAV